MSDLKIAVVGAGVIGVTTALEIQNNIRNAHVSIIADKLNEDTTSWVAAGLFRPGNSFAGPNREVTQKWINDSYHHWENIRDSSYGVEAGVAEISGYIFSSEHPSIVRNQYIEKLVPIYRRATEQELSLCPGQWKYGSFFSTIITQSTLYLPWAVSRFQSSGGELIQKHIDSLQSIGNEFDVIVNCTGLGAKYLCEDYKLVSIRGQVIKMQAPWIKTFFYNDYDTYIIPGFDGLTLGGTRQYDSYNRNIDKNDGISIRERCMSLVPSLKGGKELKQMVGLRPHRDPVRVEKEILVSHGKSIKVVHNYGHGGYGISTAPGTAIYACQLVRECLIGNSKI
ncbi:D-amino acid oxidase 1 [Leptinotarsa decemlineata]|uniref:D-amino acid oxidase 1 n=1 Tax=Leptinotarsa decemlineata TaxID=7539 RepID=UPI000C252B12|nr:D-aspartate oxidase [Leptinotarsa decemlineata]